MICPKCRYNNQDNYSFCLNCGAPLNNFRQSFPVVTSVSKSEINIISLVFGCVSLLFQFIMLINGFYYIVKYTGFYNFVSFFNDIALLLPPIAIIVLTILKKADERLLVFIGCGYMAVSSMFYFISGYYYIVDELKLINGAEYFIMSFLSLGVAVLCALSQFVKSKGFCIAAVSVAGVYVFTNFVILIFNNITGRWSSLFMNCIIEMSKFIMAAFLSYNIILLINRINKKNI